MTSPYNLVIVIPTRNRSDLAVNAIRSVLCQRQDSISVLVSDNSTDPGEVRLLQSFCNQLSHPRLLYVRPSESLPMSEHWEWALGQAMLLCPASHYAFLTDRMVFKSGMLSKLLSIIQRHPQAVVAYNHDRINDYDKSIRLEQVPWTGKIMELKSRQLMAATSQMYLHNSLPRMLNCAVPRFVFDEIREQLGNIFLSISPDYCFAFRSLAVLEFILYYDRPILIHYALRRSNGASYTRGIMSKDSADFISNLGTTTLSFAAPVPEFRTVGNAIIHEYCVVRQAMGDTMCPDVDFSAYLQHIAREIELMRDIQLQSDMRALLWAHGWRPSTVLEQAAPTRSMLIVLRKLCSPRKVLNRAKRLASQSLRSMFNNVWGSYLTQKPILGNVLGPYLAQQSSVCFLTTEAAIRFSNRFMPKPQLNLESLSLLLKDDSRIVDSLI